MVYESQVSLMHPEVQSFQTWSLVKSKADALPVLRNAHRCEEVRAN